MFIGGAVAAQAQELPHLAAQAFERAVLSNPKDLPSLQTSARALAQCGNARLATARWQEVLALDPANSEAIQAIQDLSKTAALPEAISSTAAPQEPGQGLWVDGDIRASVKTINTFNLKAPILQRIRQTYVASGQLLLAPGRSRWALDLRPVQMAADTVQGDTRAQVWIQVDARGARNLTPDVYDRLADELAATLKGEKRVSGILLEPSPASALLYPLYNAIRKQVNLPLTVVVGSAQADDFHYADVLMLRAWPRAESVESYQLRIGDEISAFLKASEASGGKGMVALAGSLTVAGKAAPYFQAGRDALSKGLGNAPTSFIGYAVHGLLPMPDGTQHDLEPEVWDLLNLAVAAATP